ncbi:winged helix-turn-helix transcriptional regulator [Aeoliella mucimassa]|nr:response regulator transcription factor [Aeoliella mucimassa]
MCRQIKEWGRLPITSSVIVLQDRFKADQVVDCLTNGASDYISGPHFSDERVLLARLHVAVRGYHLAPDDRTVDSDTPLVVGPLTINAITFRVTVADHGDVLLTKLQFHLLSRLARRPGRVFLHDELRHFISQFGGGNPTDQTIKSHMSNLRKRLGPAGGMIKTIRGVGYVLQA